MGAPTPAKPTPLRNSYWVLPGKLLAGEHPSGTNREATRERLHRLLEAGVECFIDLTEPGETKAYDPELPFSVEYLRKPIKDHSTPSQRGHMVEILYCLHDALQSGRCVYVHCRAGIGRTGTVVGCFLVERGLEGEAALDELNRLWQQSERSHSWASVPETSDQSDYVLRWKRRGIFDDKSGLSTAPLAADKNDEPDVGGGATPRGHSSGTAPERPGATPRGHSSGTVPERPGATSGARNSGAQQSTASPGGPGASRAAQANAARTAASQPDSDDDLLTDPTSVAKLFQPTPPRSATPSWVSTHKPGAAPAAAPSDRGSAKSHPNAPSTNAPATNAPSTAGQAGGSPPSTHSPRPRPASAQTAGASEPGWVSTSAPPSVATSTGSPSGRPTGARTGLDDEADPLLAPEALEAASHLRVRFLGALIGLAVGDAVAAATQYRRPGSFSPVGDMLGGGPFDLPRGGWSDDTAMALCLADSLLERNGFDARDQIERYRRWQQEGYLSATGQCVGITASTARAIAMAQWRRLALFGSHDPSQQDPEPLSRVAPAVLFFFAASGEAINQAAEAARTTCQAPTVLDACRSLARAVQAALAGQPKAVVLEKATPSITNGDPGASAAGPGGVVAQRAGMSAAAVLAAATAAFGATDNFRDAILYAANLGGDSDVVATACGQLAGAYYGVKAIPTSWYNGLMQKELIATYADRLLAHAMVSLSG